MVDITVARKQGERQTDRDRDKTDSQRQNVSGRKGGGERRSLVA